MKNIPNPFIDCSADELAVAWEIFSLPRKDGTLDTEAMGWIRDALDEKLFLHTAFIPNPLGAGGINIAILMEL